MGEPKDRSSTDPHRQYPKISHAPNWTSVFTKNPDLEAPGYVEAFLEAHDKMNHYGWAVMTSRGVQVIRVANWEQAKKEMPYQWLNRHPKQPAPVNETLDLVKETLKAINEKNKNSKEEVL